MSALKGTVNQIYNVLVAGEKIELEVHCAEDAEKFRVSLAKYKKVQDDYQIGLGMMEENEKQAIRFSLNKETMVATIAIVDKQDPRQYSFKIIKDDAENEET